MVLTRREALGSMVTATAGLGLCLAAPAGALGQDQAPTLREFSIAARKFAYTPARLEVGHNDLVKITLTSHDIAHSFTIDDYRIAKRVGPGQTVVFEFRADRPGTFPIYCNLRQDDGCRGMRGELVVRGR